MIPMKKDGVRYSGHETFSHAAIIKILWLLYSAQKQLSNIFWSPVCLTHTSKQHTVDSFVGGYPQTKEPIFKQSGNDGTTKLKRRNRSLLECRAHCLLHIWNDYGSVWWNLFEEYKGLGGTLVVYR